MCDEAVSENPEITNSLTQHEAPEAPVLQLQKLVQAKPVPTHILQVFLRWDFTEG